LQTKIYALCDYQTLQKFDISLEQYLNICIKYNTVYIQYRDKINPIDIQKQNIQYLKQSVVSLGNRDISIIINDKLELLEYCDGIHLGQEDLLDLCDKYNLHSINMIKLLRKKYKNKIIGISTHNELEILETNKLDINYIGLGAYRQTNTKDVSTIIGDNISYLAKISKHPVGAIGGVKISDKIVNVTYNVIGTNLFK
jgi:thiamine-phosphate pyrophosphorylase